ncbi:MAG: hypothetical protein KC503_00360 [Myxococcales bacterium]|nr:hypothetical protein [Myxococcales bacterium]
MRRLVATVMAALYCASPIQAAAAPAKGATLAVVNVGTRAPAFVRKVQSALARFASERARRAATAALLAGERLAAPTSQAAASQPATASQAAASQAAASQAAASQPAASQPAASQAAASQPAASEPAVPADIARAVARLRAAKGLSGEHLFELGRALGVDYLLLIKPARDKASSSAAARLYSVHRLRFAPQGYEGPRDAQALARYVQIQVRGRPQKKKWYKKWWVWAVGAGLAALSVSIIVIANSRSDQLTVRVTRQP